MNQRLEVVLKSSDFIEYVDSVREERDMGHREIEFAEPGGSIWAEVNGSIVPGSSNSGSPWTLFVLHDVTERKRLEVVRMEFVANVSHELKTPLSIIKGYAETLVDEHRSMEEDTRAQLVETISRHTQRLTAIVEDLLVLSRLESGSAPIVPEPQNLVSLLETLVSEVEGRLSRSGHSIRLDIGDARNIPVTIDRIRFSMVFANLIDNAQKYTRKGSTISVRARSEVVDHEVEVWVEDDGPGIPATELARMFERFYRVEKGRSRETGGTGLGLSIVKRIVLLHGGRIWAESKLGEGTRIAFRLPLQPEDVIGGPVASERSFGH